MIALSILAVVVGGAAGALARWGLAEAWRARRAATSSSSLAVTIFPWPTFAANVLGSFLVGLLLPVVLAAGSSAQPLYVLLITGFCGALSTLSTAAFEVLDFARRGTTVFGVSYLLLSVGAGLAAFWLGLVITA